MAIGERSCVRAITILLENTGPKSPAADHWCLDVFPIEQIEILENTAKTRNREPSLKTITQCRMILQQNQVRDGATCSIRSNFEQFSGPKT